MLENVALRNVVDEMTLMKRHPASHP